MRTDQIWVVFEEFRYLIAQICRPENYHLIIKLNVGPKIIPQLFIDFFKTQIALDA